MQARCHWHVQVARVNALKEVAMRMQPGLRQKAKALGLQGRAMLLDERVPPFHLEFSREGRRVSPL